MDSLPTELWGRGFILQKKRKSLVGLQIFKYGTGAKVQTFGPCWEASESTELAPATESESGVGLRRTQRGQCRRWGWGLQTDFLCFPKLEITILFAFRRLWGKILLKKFCVFFWLELHPCGKKGRLAITCISGPITNTVS